MSGEKRNWSVPRNCLHEGKLLVWTCTWARISLGRVSLVGISLGEICRVGSTAAVYVSVMEETSVIPLVKTDPAARSS